MNRNAHLSIIGATVLLPVLAILSGPGCRQQTAVTSQLTVPGYTSRLIVDESFTENLTNWQVEGDGNLTITQDGRIRIAENPGSDGVMLWLKKEFENSFLIEYEVELPDTNGVNVLHFCAQSLPGKNFFQRNNERSGSIEDYGQGDLMSYQVAYHCYTPDGFHENGSRLRKNPGSLLLARKTPDPCAQNRFYLIDAAKTGNRIQFFVDKEKIHDLRDRGGFGDVYSEGRIGFWIHGAPDHFSTYLNNLRVFNLIPE